MASNQTNLTASASNGAALNHSLTARELIKLVAFHASQQK
jgi:hypothetical protein